MQALLSALVGATVLVASPAAPADEATLVLGAVGDLEVQHRAVEVIASHVGGAGVRVLVEQSHLAAADLGEQIAWARDVGSRHQAVGVFWIDARDDELLLYLIDRSGDRVLVRTVPKDPQSPAASYEAVGVVARSITEALLAGATIGMQEVAVAEPEPPAPAEPEVEPIEIDVVERPSPWHRLNVTLGYRGASFADELPWLSGIGAELSARPRRAFVLGLSYAFFFPDYAQHPSIIFSVQRNAASAFAGLHAGVGRRLAVDLRGIATVDVVRQRVLEVASDLDAAPDSTRVLFSLGADARLWIYAWRGFGFFAGVGLEVVTNPFSYVVVQEGRDVALDTHRVRGVATAGLGYGFWLLPPRERR